MARILVESQPQGVELTHIFSRSMAKRRVDWVPESVVWTDDAAAVLASPDVDVLVELAGGLDPAGSWVRAALENGKSVVTANKKLISYQGVELERLAAVKGGHLMYGAAVAGGIPVIPGLEQGWRATASPASRAFSTAPATSSSARWRTAPTMRRSWRRRRPGYAEADPTEDVGGFDARAKLAILMRLALRVEVNPEEIVPRPITPIRAVDFSYARDLGCTIRQVARGDLNDGQVAATVGPMLVAQRSPLAWSRGTENMVIFSGKYGGDVVFSGHGAGGHPTAVAVVSDLLALAYGSRRVEVPSATAAVDGEFEVPHYIRFLVTDKPGIIADITVALAKEGINIRAIVQKPGYPAKRAAFCDDGRAMQIFGAQAGAGMHARQGLSAGRAAGFADAGVAIQLSGWVISAELIRVSKMKVKLTWIKKEIIAAAKSINVKNAFTVNRLRIQRAIRLRS